MFSKVYYTACSWAFCFLILGVVFPHIVTVKKKKNPKDWYLRRQWLFKGSEHLNTWANEEVAIIGDNIIITLPITIFHQLHNSSEATYKLISLAVFPQVLLHCKSLLNHVQYFPEIAVFESIDFIRMMVYQSIVRSKFSCFTSFFTFLDKFF